MIIRRWNLAKPIAFNNEKFRCEQYTARLFYRVVSYNEDREDSKREAGVHDTPWMGDFFQRQYSCF